jgi:ABC-type methionine transport system permease subunit
MLMIILVVFLLLALGGGGLGHSRYGYTSWSPAAVIVAVLAVLWLTGNMRG